MIARHWRGLARRESAAPYHAHLHDETFPALERLRGFLGGSILRREVAGGVEFLVITEWQSLDAIRAFAGEDADAAVVPANVQAMMIEYDAVVRHYEILERQ
jgi:heme-degrading monooxygenase HmoA